MKVHSSARSVILAVVSAATLLVPASSAQGQAVPTQERAETGMVPGCTIRDDGRVQMCIHRSGTFVSQVTVQIPGYMSGNQIARIEFHGRRPVTGGDSQAIGPQGKIRKVCDRFGCLHQWRNVDFRYGCNDWIWGRITLDGIRVGTPVYHFC